MKKYIYKLAICVSCDFEEFCRLDDGERVCDSCLGTEEWPADEFDGPSDADPGM